MWIDHCAFNDGEHPDNKQPSYFGRLYQAHDGQLDVTKAADLVTVSWNRFADHDKALLIGSSDTATADAGKLNVTVHHNVFSNIGQRAPRVRFGKVHVYDNLYLVLNAEGYTYSWGVGVDSKLYAENNVFRVGPGVQPDRFTRVFNGKALRAFGTLVQDGTKFTVIDAVGVYNRTNEPKLADDVGWIPSLVGQIDRAEDVPARVERAAGPL